MEAQERNIDMRQFLLYLWEHVVIFALVVLLCGMAMGCFSYKKQKAAASGTIASISQIVSTNRSAYFEQDNDNYTDAIIPEGVYNSYGRVYVDYSLEELGDSETIDSDMLDRVSHDITMLVRSSESMSEIIDELDLRKYPDMKNITENDLSYMINANLQGIHIVNIVVSDVNPERATLLEKEVMNKFVEKAPVCLGYKNVRILDEASELDDAVESAWTLNKKKLLKYFVFGCVVGFVFVGVLFFVLFIFIDAVRTDEDVRFVGADYYGNIPLRNKETSYTKIAYSLLNEEGISSIVIVPVDKRVDITEMCDSINSVFKDKNQTKKVISSKSIDVSADALEKLQDADAALLVSKFGKTSVKLLMNAVSEVNRSGKKNLGIIISDARFTC